MEITFDLCLEVLHKFYAKAEDLDALYLTLCVLHGVLSLTAILGNVVIIFALQKASSIPSTSRRLMQARRHQASINSQAQAANHLSNVTNLARNSNLAIKTLYVFVVFEVCYLPYLITLQCY
ncbi:hypothetical protein OS493_009208 [Desmophyllum pertusum]|uniref:G-protein coupled receptors family 1 profile domain-containing protein n=1 Tax=Desmophyllum pertusum TaxID=174260 RepID=A0A9W9Z5S0_9CNID|nr:hypothetical protein OS493_009208 [Desmophyllum pertusum]